MTLSETIPNMYNAKSRTKSIPKTCLISFRIFFQKSKIIGQSQNICVKSPTNPQPLQHISEVLLYLEVIHGVIKYLILIFQSNSLHVGLLVTLCPALNVSSHCSSVIIIFASNSHFSLTSKLLLLDSCCSTLYNFDIAPFFVSPSVYWC